jgi:uracil phosphoribosyltransferase
VLLERGVDQGRILFLSLIAAPEGIHKISRAYPQVKIITSEIDEALHNFHVIPGETSEPSGRWAVAAAVGLRQLVDCVSALTSEAAPAAGVGEFGDRYFCD